ncbi:MULTISPECIES: hypothetical protein [Methylomicrobium]|uniref:Uncharacterized protein n=1 Tax=Methylomicrobium album BG8 TaxID=686340 RepID=H8GQK1_METAL|nr:MULTISPECIES: hypothetical protein [Methylomicrobium]EIC29828.1 hypothetical protein Metal_2070 [Methylomicrobium album BG8]
MNPSKRWKYLKIWVLISLALIVLFPDVVFDTTTNILGFLFDHFVEFSHILFESVEMVLDHVIEHLFETDLHSTQTIVFYVLLAIGSYLLYRMGRYFLHLYRRSRLAWSEFRTEHPFDAMEYWRELTRFEKIKLIVIPMVILYLYVMFFM